MGVCYGNRVPPRCLRAFGFELFRQYDTHAVSFEFHSCRKYKKDE